MVRLQKYLAFCGIASRRKSEELISQGLVTVNGETVISPGFIVSPENDLVLVSGKELYPEKKYYFLFNKPSNVLCSAGNPRGRKTVYDYFKDVDARLFTVGRLDYHTSGLIIVTNDGDLANYISHPSNEKAKEYTVRINSYLSDKDIKLLEQSSELDGYRTHPAKVQLISRSRNVSAFNIVIHEGRNRQIRKMVEKLNHKVVFLRRIRIAELIIGDLKEGQYRKLKAKEIALLKT